MTSASLQVTSAPTEPLAGLVERVTFHNEENGFCVLRLGDAIGRIYARPLPILTSGIISDSTLCERLQRQPCPEVMMSFQEIGLGKLLKSMIVPAPERRRMLRDDVGHVLGKLAGTASEAGGDFYGPFWADAKRHVAGELDLRQATEDRIAANKVSRQRLYPQLNDGFLGWWEQKRRQRNEPFRVIEGTVKARHSVAGLGTVKVDNTMAITIGLDGHRIIYPYFYLDVALNEEVARIGLWVMSQCVTGYDLQDMRVLDVFRGRSFSILDTPLAGDEEAQLAGRYAALLGQWQEIRDELG